MKNLENSFKFKNWKQSLIKNDITIKEIKELNTIYKKDGEVLFSFLNVNAIDETGKPLLPMVLIRGHFVVVLVVLIDSETSEKYCLLVKQRRIADGSIFYEHPAGMCDADTDPIQVALKEVHEETGLEITKESLFLLTNQLLYSSPGLLDEGGYFFACELTKHKSEIESLQNRTTGEQNENEFITTHICKFEESFGLLKNTNGLLTNYLYLNHLNQKS